MLQVREERTGWRDQAISGRHRQWGYDCPALDIDFLMLEYDRGKASALVEYKHEDAPPIQLGHPSVRALIDLAEPGQVPLFITRYSADFAHWYPTPVNAPARLILPEAVSLSEQQWVELLYRCRGRTLPMDWSIIA